MEYEEVVEYIFNLRRFGKMKLGLERIGELVKGLDNPHKKYKIIHVGGSNGKGSTVAMIDSILRSAGYKVGKFTSPHLSRFTERITVNGKEIPEKEVIRLFCEIKKISEKLKEKPTFFEVTTAMAFKWFEEQKVDFVVLEVGLGGRLDATNIVNPIVSVITNIAQEHTEVLGDDVLDIAHEKAGIIKTSVPLVTAERNELILKIFKDLCKKQGCKIFRVGEDILFTQKESNLEYQKFDIESMRRYRNLCIPLLGSHQILNAATAVGVIEALLIYGIHIPERAVREGLANVKWPGRLEIVQRKPLVVLDCAKDPLAMKNLRKALKSLFDYENLILVISVSSDKKVEKMLKEILPITDHLIATKHNVQNRATNPETIVNYVKPYKIPFEIIKNVKDATKKAIKMAQEKDLVCITGSIFTVGEARELWFRKDKTKLGRGLNEPANL